jgi:hypothetical protein
VSSNTINITLTDGGKGDADGLADGVIVDPGGLVITTPTNVIPEVPFGTVMIFVCILIALVGFAGFKRFRPKLQPQK